MANTFEWVTAAGTQAVTPDASQRRVIDLPDDASASVLGAPGTGKTTTLIELVADRVIGRGWAPHQVVALTPSRATATRLRDALALRLQVATTGPLARSVNSLAFELVRAAAATAGAPVPRLVTGGEQDADIASLLQGHLDESTGPAWPDHLGPEVRGLARFRTELRELMMRATEYDVSPARLRQLGRDRDRPEWVAAADFIDEYVAVVSTSRPAQLDPAELARFAVEAVDSGTASAIVDPLRLVMVDDLQEATESTVALLRALARRGVAVIAFGDPDVAVNAFRGGEPDALGRLASVLGKPGIPTLTLSTAHRQGPAVRALTAAVTGQIGAAAAGTQRAATAGGVDAATPIARVEEATPAREWAAIARVLREEHLERGIPWSEMVVIVRSGAQLAAVARSLALAEVPTRTTVGALTLRDDGAARGLLTLVDVGIGRTALTAALATELLLGPFGGLDTLGLRRLRLALRAEEVAGGGSRSADELLVDALAHPGRLATIDHRVGRVAERLGETLELLKADGGSIEQLLWLGWERSGLAVLWREQALGAGIAAVDANRNLDGIVALFTAAKRFVERQPDGAATTFLDNVLDAEVPEDTLSPQPHESAVLVTTPAATVGLEFDTVVVAALQDGVWPNRRLRGSLLAPQQLVRVVTASESASLDERRQVLGDELRMFALAVSRARRRVVLATVANEDDAPSSFLAFAPVDSPLLSATTSTPLSLRAMVGELRKELVSGRSRLAGPASGAGNGSGNGGNGGSGGTGRGGARAAAAASLAALAVQHIPGADPDDWHGLLEVSTSTPLYESEQVPVSPSAIDKLEESPLDWFLSTMASSDPGVEAKLGTLLHAAMETGVPDVESLWALVESRWNELVFDAPWLGERQRRIARRLTEALSQYLRDAELAGKTVVSTELSFELTIDRAVVRGTIDRIERSPEGGIMIVDLKTGTPKTSQSVIDEHPQLGVYQLALANGALDEALATAEPTGTRALQGAKLVFVKDGAKGRLYRDSVQPPFDAERLSAFRERVRRGSLLIAAAEFAGIVEFPARGRGDTSGLRLNRVRAVSSD